MIARFGSNLKVDLTDGIQLEVLYLLTNQLAVPASYCWIMEYGVQLNIDRETDIEYKIMNRDIIVDEGKQYFTSQNIDNTY